MIGVIVAVVGGIAAAAYAAWRTYKDDWRDPPHSGSNAEPSP